MESVLGGVGAVPVGKGTRGLPGFSELNDISPYSSNTDDRQNDQLWRSATNGSESHTSANDEFNVRQLLLRDAVEALERETEKDDGVPRPSTG